MTDDEFEKMKLIVGTVERLKAREKLIQSILDVHWDVPGHRVSVGMQELHDDMLRRGADVMKQGVAESIAAIQFATENAASPQSGGARKMVILEESESEVRVLPSQ